MEDGAMNLPDFDKLTSIRIKEDDPDWLRCRVYYNGRPTSVFAARPDIASEYALYVDHQPDKPIIKCVRGWGAVGGIAMLIEGLASLGGLDD